LTFISDSTNDSGHASKTNVQEAGEKCVVSVIQMATPEALILPTFPTSFTVVLSQVSAALKP
jgi:hypothetical protein